VVLSGAGCARLVLWLSAVRLRAVERASREKPVQNGVQFEVPRFSFEDSVARRGRESDRDAAALERDMRSRGEGGRRRTVCKHWMLGKCMMGGRCVFAHRMDSARVPACEFFARGECAHGEHCRFRHEGVAVRPEEPVEPSEETSSGSSDGQGPSKRARTAQSEPGSGSLPPALLLSFGDDSDSEDDDTDDDFNLVV